MDGNGDNMKRHYDTNKQSEAKGYGWFIFPTNGRPGF